MTKENLEKNGWKKAFTADGQRLQEAIEFYKEIGYEVKLIPFVPDEEKECTECMVNSGVMTIYIKKKKED